MPLHEVGGPEPGRPRLPLGFERGPVGAHALANGELSEEDAREFEQLKAVIEARSGFSCNAYKERCLRRRLAVRMRARGCTGTRTMRRCSSGTPRSWSGC